ncbi:hypothetical protein [Pseudanabaena sp. BC1403]|nr:hypothetical protein [Pseudanabaena sp. BC1403]
MLIRDDGFRRSLFFMAKPHLAQTGVTENVTALGDRKLCPKLKA